MIFYQAMQVSNFIGRLHLNGEAKYVSIFDSAVGFDPLPAEHFEIWATKNVHGSLHPQQS